MTSDINERYKFARGSVTDEIKEKLITMIKASVGSNKENLLSEDIIELIAVARSEKEGFRAVNKLLDTFIEEYK
jgi:hypothetical protein